MRVVRGFSSRFVQSFSEGKQFSKTVECHNLISSVHQQFLIRVLIGDLFLMLGVMRFVCSVLVQTRTLLRRQFTRWQHFDIRPLTCSLFYDLARHDAASRIPILPSS